MSDSAPEFERHLIQLTSVGVKELSLRANRPPALITPSEVGEAKIRIGYSEFDPESRLVKVFMRVESSGQDDVYSLTVEIVGEFTVSTEFSEEKIAEWAAKAAPFVLYPFLREHVFSLCVRAQLRPLLLPLIQVPIFGGGKRVARAEELAEATEP